MDEHQDHDVTGIGVEDLPALMRELYDQCVADARAQADPNIDLEGFLEELWVEVSAAFGLVRRDWPEDAPRPWPVLLEERRGVAEAILDGRVPPGSEA